MPDMTPTVATEALSRARRLLLAIEDAKDDPKHLVEQIRQQLDVIEGALKPRAVRRRTGEDTIYKVERNGQALVLSEYRPIGNPQRVDADLVIAVVGAIMMEESTPLAFDDIMKGTEIRADTRPAEWQVRVILRFLMKGASPALRRSRSRYLPARDVDFNRAVERQWKLAGGTHGNALPRPRAR